MIRLAAFDMDGTLTLERSSWDTLFKCYGHDPEPFYRQYAEGRIDQDEWAAANMGAMIERRPGLTAAEVERALVENSHVRAGVGECVSRLTALGIRCVIISAGTAPLADWIGKRAGFHDWRANWFESDALGRLVPRYVRRVSYLEKEIWLRSWQRQFGISREETVAVGDSCNDVGMFLEAGHSIALQPTDECAAAVAEVVHEGEDLSECADLIERWCGR